MAVAWNGDGAVYEGADERPDETRYGLRPATQQLQTEGHAVDIGAVVRDDAKRQNDKTELAETAEGWEEDGCKESADAGLLVAVCVTGIDCVEGRCCDRQTEHFRETKGYDETAVCPGEGFDS